MAIKTQLRLLQMTGSLNDNATAVAHPRNITTASLQGPLDQLASAIRRITGGSAYTSQAAGEFTHATSIFSGDITVQGNDINAGSDAAATLFSEVTSADLTLGGGGKVITAGDLQVNGTAINGDADEARTIFASNTGQPITLGGGGVVQTAGQLKVDGEVIQDSGGDARIGFANAGDITLNDKDGNTAVTVNGTSKNVSLAADADVAGTLQVTLGANLDFDVWVGRDLYVSGTSINLANDAGLWSAAGQLQDYLEGNTRIMGAEGLYVDQSLFVSGASDSIFAGNINGDSDASRILFESMNNSSNSLQLGGGADVFMLGDAILIDDKKLRLGSTPSTGDASIEYNNSDDALRITAGVAGDAADMILALKADSSVIKWEFDGTDQMVLAEVGGAGALQIANIKSPTGAALVLSGADKQVLDVQGSKSLQLGDNFPDFATGWTGNYIRLSNSKEEWETLAATYGDGVTLLQGIISGSSAGESRVKSSTAITGSYAANERILLTDWSTVGILESAAISKIDVYVNGQLLVSGSAKGSDGGGDYSLGNWGGEEVDGVANKKVAYFNFALEADDRIMLISR